MKVFCRDCGGFASWIASASLRALMVAAGFISVNALCHTGAAQEVQPATATAATVQKPKEVVRPVWLEDYGVAKQQATDAKKMLFIWFYDPQSAQSNASFEASMKANPTLETQLTGVVAVKLPTTTKLAIDGKETNLISHPAFGELYGSPGIAMIDYVDSRLPYYGHVVSAYPFNRRTLGSHEVSNMVTLPQGTITQRTLLFVVRCHPEAPRSGFGRWHPVLADQCQDHSFLQARMSSMGHHNWGYRAANISAMLGGAMPNEVCAQTSGGARMIDSAEELVNTWRHSPAHWQGVAGSHSYVAYDMKQGPSGHWFGTGIFAR